jgi:peptide/nickel transport system permease protein
LGQYIIRRLIGLILVMFGMTLMTFVISHIVPADPAAAAAGFNAGAEQIEEIRHRMGLDRPLPEQYLHYLWGVLHGDLGQSILNQRPVLQDILTFLPASVELALVSLLICTPLGILLGILAGWRAGSIIDAITRLFSIAGVSMPVFWLAMLFQLLFFKNLRWFPARGRLDVGMTPPPTVTGFYLIDTLLAGDWAGFVSAAHHIALPAITLAIANLAVITRMTRSSLLEVLSQDYIRTARAKGVSEWLLLRRHALKNAMVPVVTVMGLQLAALIAYVFLVEVIFSWPGIGTYAVRAIIGLDFEPIMGITLTFSLIYVVTNFFVDIVYLFLNPQIRY